MESRRRLRRERRAAVRAAGNGACEVTDVGGRRLTIIGGGIMGLMTAYHAAPLAASVSVLDCSRIGDPATASFGLTRSVRSDYLDPLYARLAAESRRLWRELERELGEPLIIGGGCLNLAKASVTPDIAGTYGAASYAVLRQLGLPCEELDAARMREQFPQFAVDAAWLDADGGFADLAVITRALRDSVRSRGAVLTENAPVRAITRSGGSWQVRTDAGTAESDVLVVTAGLGTNDVLGLVPDCPVRFPLRPDRPAESKYFIPGPGDRAAFTETELPVFAYLDVGIYGHPLYDGRTPGVKIALYNPPDVPRADSRIAGVADFVAECLPGLHAVETVDVAEASGVDTCHYDLVADDTFILGPVPGPGPLYTGVGWRGTGYKFAPWVGRVLAQLALQQGTVYDISRFAPGRFAGAPATRQEASP